MRYLFCLLLLVFCNSCGYHLGQGNFAGTTVSIPYVSGDEKGILTNALIKRVSAIGYPRYANNGDYILCVCLQEIEDEKIGFEYAPEQDSSALSNIVVSDEGRLTATAQVKLIECATGRCCLGPMQVKASLSFDFEPDLSNLDVNAFSLGQFEMYSLAKDAALPTLYTLLAEKIVDCLVYSW